MCKISIITPVYNVEQFIGECIESVLMQDMSDFELILVDDGSKDDSLSICREYAKKDSRIKVYSKENGGVSSARNLGIQKSEGEYLCFIDSDDFVTANYCSSLLNYITSEIQMVILGLQKVYPDGTAYPIKHRFATGIYSYDELSKKIIDDGTMSGFTVHSSCAVLFNGEFIRSQALLFNENVRFNEDGLFTTEYFLKCGKSAYIDYGNIVYSYRTNLDSATSTVDLLSEKYRRSMQTIENVLISMNDTHHHACIKDQVAMRRVTEMLSKMIYLARKGDLTQRYVKTLLCENDTSRYAIRLLDTKAMGKQKAMLVLAMRLRCYWIISQIMKMRFK